MFYSCIGALVLLLINTVEASPQSIEAIDDATLSCAVSCWEKQRRLCASPPTGKTPVQCGSCIKNHVDVDGHCRPQSMRVAEEVPKVNEAFYQEINRKRRRLDEERTSVEIKKGADPWNSGDTDFRHNRPKQVMDSGSAVPYGSKDDDDYLTTKVIIISVVAAISAVMVIALLVLSIYCCYRLQKSKKAASPVEYSSYGTGEQYGGYTVDKPPSSDRKLAHSAQMFHYQHQKQQMLELEKAREVAAANGDSGASSDDDATDDRYTVYECPGLADPGDMEVRNPLYTESPMPPSPPLVNGPPADAGLPAAVPIPHGPAGAPPGPVSNGHDAPPAYSSLHTPP